MQDVHDASGPAPHDVRDADARVRAVRHLRMRAGFQYHLAAYVLVNLLLVGVWALTGPALFWPLFPILGWGLGLAFHALVTFRAPLSEDRIQREMQRQR